jgi:hypothetical protein
MQLLPHCRNDPQFMSLLKWEANYKINKNFENFNLRKYVFHILTYALSYRV